MDLVVCAWASFHYDANLIPSHLSLTASAVIRKATDKREWESARVFFDSILSTIPRCLLVLSEDFKVVS